MEILQKEIIVEEEVGVDILKQYLIYLYLLDNLYLLQLEQVELHHIMHLLMADYLLRVDLVHCYVPQMEEILEPGMGTVVIIVVAGKMEVLVEVLVGVWRMELVKDLMHRMAEVMVGMEEVHITVLE